MTRTRSIIALAIIFGIYSTSLLSFENNDLFSKVLIHFKKNSFHYALDELESIKTKNSTEQAEKKFYQGLILKNMGDYKGSGESYEKAIKLKIKRKDIYYEYGQALYAMNDLVKAKKAFGLSIRSNFKPLISAYYIAYTNQILEKYTNAEKQYKIILKKKSLEPDLKQVIHFQLAETIFQIAREKENAREIVRDQILPELDKAKKVKPKSKMVRDITKREKELKVKYWLDPNIMINGKKIPLKRYAISFSQGISYDDNITLVTDLPATQATQRSSYILNTSLRSSYDFVFKNRYILTPALSLSKTRHTNRDQSDVFKNDSHSINPSLNLDFEHSLFKKPATLILGYNHNYIARDRDAIQNVQFYGRSNDFTLGEKFRYFSFGNTSFKLNLKDYAAYKKDLSYTSYTISLDQTVLLPIKHLLTFFVMGNFTRLDNPANDINYYTFKTDYIIPEFIKNFGLIISSSLSLQNPVNQRLTRGLETIVTPGVKLTRSFGKKKNMSLEMSYNYTSKNSKDKTSQTYTKNTASLTFRLRY